MFLILLVYRVVFLHCLRSCYLLFPMLPVSIGSSFMIAPSVHSYGVFFTQTFKAIIKKGLQSMFYSIDILFIIIFTSKTIK